MNDTLDTLREADRSLRLMFADDAERSASELAQHFGEMLDAFAQLAADVGSDTLLGHVDRCRASVDRIANSLRTIAQSARY